MRWCGVAVVLRAFRAGKKGGRSAHWGGGWCRNFPKLVTSCLISKFAFFSRHCYSGLLQGLSGLCLSLISHTYTHIHTPYMSITSHHEDKARSHTVDSFHPELSSRPIEALLLLCYWGAPLNEDSVLGQAQEPKPSVDDVDDDRQYACGRESKHENEPACLASYDRRSSRPRHFLCVCLCACVCVYPVPRDLPLPLPYPPNRRVAGCHWVRYGVGGGECGSWRNPMITGRPTQAPVNGQHPLLAKSFWGFLLTLLTCLPVLPTCAPGAPPRPACVASSPWSYRLAVASRSGTGEEEKGGRSGPEQFTLTAESGVSQERLGAGGTARRGLCRT